MKSNLDKLKEMTKNLQLRDEDRLELLETLTKVVEDTTDGYWDWHVGSGKNGEEDYEYLSPRFKEQFGYKDSELDNVPSSWQKIMYPEDLKVMFEEVTKHFESKGEYIFSCVGRYTHKKGHQIVILCRGKVVDWNDDGSPKRMVGTHTDITNIK